MMCTEFVLESCIAALGTRAGLVALGFMRRKFLLLPFSRIVVNQGHATCHPDFLSDHRAATCCVHQFVTGINSLSADTCERQCDPAVMYVRASKNGANGYATAGRIQMQLVAFPTDFVTQRVLLGAHGASRVEFKWHLLKRLALLALQWAGLGGAGEFRILVDDRVSFFGLAGLTSTLSFFAMDSRASMAVESRLM